MTADAAAFLSAYSFSRFTTLGAPLPELVAHRLFWNGKELDPERAARELSRELKRLGGYMAHDPELGSAVHAVLKSANFSLIEVLRVAVHSDPTTTGHVFPTILSANPPAKRETTTTEEFADSHMHSGATLSLEALIELGIAARGEFPRKLRAVSAYDTVGRKYSLGVIFVATIRAIQHRLSVVNASPSPVAESVATAIGEGNYWPQVRSMAESFEAPLEVPGRALAWDELASLGPVPELIDLDAKKEVAKVLADLFSHKANSSLEIGLIHAIFLIHGFLRSDHGEGLSAFVSRFSRVSEFRKLASGEQRARTLSRSVRDVFTDNVVAAEFRKTIDPTDGHSFETEILQDLKEHILAFDNSGVFEVQSRGASMPVTFRRKPATTLRDDGLLQLIHPLDRHQGFAEALAGLLERWPGLLPLIPGVDVVGNELHQPNWAFIPALQMLSDRLPSPFRINCHAGEHFAWPLQGIRSVGELVRPNRVVDHIGHALSLDPLCADLITGPSQPRYDARSVMDDLCWLSSVGLASSEVLDFSERLIGWLGMKERGVTFEDFAGAWRDRRRFSTIAESFRATLDAFPAATMPADLALNMSGRRLALALMLYRGPAAGFEVLDGFLPDDLASAYSRINDSVCEGVGNEVLRWIIEDGVVIEACPTSNLTLAGIPRPRHHPLMRWISAGAVVTVSSDDPTHFSTRVSEEVEIVRRTLDATDFAALLRNSVLHCAPAGVRWDSRQIRQFSEAARIDAWGLISS